MTSQPATDIATSDNPQVIALRTFITETLAQPLSEIHHWNILHKPEYPFSAEFSVRFGDGSQGYTGQMVEGMDGWQVYAVRAVMTISGNAPSMTWQP